ncbi:MAG: hypothetical protein ACOC23_06610, partial [Thermodesulfobacteriota bacterium]
MFHLPSFNLRLIYPYILSHLRQVIHLCQAVPEATNQEAERMVGTGKATLTITIDQNVMERMKSEAKKERIRCPNWWNSVRYQTGSKNQKRAYSLSHKPLISLVG